MANQTTKKRNRKSQGRRQGGKHEATHDKSKKARLSSDDAEQHPAYKDHDSRLINITQEGHTWYQYEKSIEERSATLKSGKNKSVKGSSAELASKYRKVADEIYRKEVQIFSGSKDERWVESTIRKGTLKDRIAAMSVIVSQDPIHKFHALDGLLQMAGGSSESGVQANSRVAQLAAEALEDLFLNTLLPPDRKLLTLDQRELPPLDSGKLGKKIFTKTLSPRILLLWRYEEMVKEKYESFLRNFLTRTLREGLELTKIAALRTAAALLRSVPEGESLILGLIVNKLGDPQKKTAASAGHELRSVLKTHPNMQLVIAREVQQLAHRPHLSSRALYNCVAFLNQLKLERNEKCGKDNDTLSAALINTYFKLFEVAIKITSDRTANNEVSARSRLLQALLIGINRAYPYLPEKDKHMDGHIDELYRVVHTAPAGAATQALTLLFHISVGCPTQHDPSRSSSTSAQSEDSLARGDRYFRALFAAISGTALLSHGKHSTMFFNVLYKSMKFDKDSNRVVAFAKRLLSTALHCGAPAFAASIFVLNEVSTHNQELLAYLEEAPAQDSARTVLLPHKREPRSAFAFYGQDQGDGEGGKHVDTTNGIRRLSSWELSLASYHYHPSVSKFASTVGGIKYHGNPMQDFSLALFLDKFSYRNPKTIKEGSKRAKGGVGSRRTLRNDATNIGLALPVNDPSFIRRSDTSVQDEFFRKFFVERASRMDTAEDSTKKAEKDDFGNEDDALDVAEADILDDFSSFQQNWESDSDEEAFVDSLAQKMLVDNAGGEPVDIDDDPDMDDWGNLSDNDDDAAGAGPVQYADAARDDYSASSD